MRIAFDSFAFDTARRQLLQEGQAIDLSPKAFALLGCLLDHRPAAVSRFNIQREVWRGVHVSEGNLAVVVAELRRALGDDARRPRYVRTVHGYGYAFVGAATPVAGHGATTLALVWDGERAPLAAGETVLGRGDAATVRIASPDVSRRHARLSVRDETVLLEDLGSKNGTRVRGTRIEEPVEIQVGTAFELGPVTVTLVSSSDDETTKTSDPTSSSRS